MTRSTKVVCGAVVLAALVGLRSRGRAEEPRVPPERATAFELRGRVVDDATGQPMAGVPVSLLYESTVTDGEGQFRFEKVALNHNSEISLRVKNKVGYIIGCITVDVPVKFYPLAAASGDKVDVQVVDPAAGEPVELRLKSVPPSKVSAYCNGCHEANPCLEDLSYVEYQKRGKDLRGIIISEDNIEEFKKKLVQQGLRKESYQKIRYQDSHPDGMNMEVLPTLQHPKYKGLYRRPKDLVLLEDKMVICDTCHTRHVPTNQRQYVVRPFEKESDLCYQCHL